ncbi:hypothetical protein S83_051551, partial [Arachis hypogaea]
SFGGSQWTCKEKYTIGLGQDCLAFYNEVVDGKFSQNCFLMALDSFYKVFCEKFEKLEGKPFSMAEANYFVFHSPYNKLVQKSFGRLFYNDFLRVE